MHHNYPINSTNPNSSYLFNPFTNSKNKQNHQQSKKQTSFTKLTLKPIHSNDKNFQRNSFQIKNYQGSSGMKQCEQVELKMNISLLNSQFADKKSKEQNRQTAKKKLNPMSQITKQDEQYQKRNVSLLKVINNLEKRKNQQAISILVNQIPSNDISAKKQKKLISIRHCSQTSLWKPKSQHPSLDPLSLSIGVQKPVASKKTKYYTLKPKIYVKQEENSQSDEDEEYLDDATPGPGNYSYEDYNKKKQFRSKKDKFKHIFYSHIERFHEPQQSNHINSQALSVSNYMSSSVKPHKLKQSPTFISKTCKIPQAIDLGVPPPGSYNTRQTLQNDIVKNILKSSNTNIFISQQPRQYKVYKKDGPGPGHYSVDRKEEILQEQYNSLSSAFKKKNEVRICRQYQEKIDLIKMVEDMPVSQIHVKNQLDMPNYLSLPPPFLSGSSRFPSTKPITYQASYTLPVQKKNIKNEKGGWRKAKEMQFGRIKDKDWQVGQGVGVGIYDISGGLKKSFNLLNNY